MAGRIKDEDVAEVKARASIEDVVREHVTMRPAGPGRLKGLCPFHDEKTPSFTVRPAVGAWHCFGCNEGGDVISFVQRVDHLSFVEAVERLAGAAGVQLRYEEGGGPRGEGPGRRTRLLEAHRVAAGFYHEALLSSPEARPGRDFLRSRGFDSSAAAHFTVGYAGRSGTELAAHLRDKGFTDTELVEAGLSATGRRGGLYDRFRGRLVWPIRDITGDTVGFGARRLYADDRVEAKYLNTAETSLYRKGSLLYGLDLAKRAIARQRQVVVVEGYTDVMACHLSGVDTAVATCGTAFGGDHIAILRRLLRDERDVVPARTVFTFDGDAAGQKAALRAFSDDQRWAAQSQVAVAPDGMDPCDLRQQRGDQAVRDLVDHAVPMFEFVIRATVARFDLGTAEGRVGAIRAVAPVVAGIRDQARHHEYARTVAGQLGVSVEQMMAEVARAGRRTQRESATPARSAGQSGPVPPAPAPTAGTTIWPDRSDPVVDLEAQLLQVLVQFPATVSDRQLATLSADLFAAPAHREVFEAVRHSWPAAVGLSSAAWLDQIRSRVPESLAPLVTQLAVALIRVRTDQSSGEPDAWSVQTLLDDVREHALLRLIADGTSELRRVESSDPEQADRLSARLTEFQRDLADLRSRAD